MKSVHHDSLLRLGRSIAAGLGTAAALLIPASALAAQVTLISPTTAGITFNVDTSTGTSTAICPFASVIGDAAGNLTFTCTGSTATPAAGTLALNTFGTATGIPVSSGSTSFSVSRTGGTAGAVSGNVSVTGGCTLSTPVVNFSDGSAVPFPSTVTLNASSATTPGPCVVTLATGNANLGSPSTLSVNITPQSPGVLALNTSNTASAIAVTSGVTTIAVTRNNGTSGIVTGTLGVTGGCSLSAASVSFADGSTTASPASVTIGAGTAAGGGSCQVSLTGATGGATVGTPSSTSISITASTTPPPPTGCTTNATETVNWAGQQIFKDLKAGETLAIAVNLSAYPLASRTDYLMQVVEGGSLSLGADIQYTVSHCPGDFNAGVTLGEACHKHTSFVGDSISFKVGPPTATRTPICWLPTGTTTAYYNIRPIMRPTPSPPNAVGTPSCPIGQLCRFSMSLSR
jgi:hypothetical protein